MVGLAFHFYLVDRMNAKNYLRPGAFSSTIPPRSGSAALGQMDLIVEKWPQSFTLFYHGAVVVSMFLLTLVNKKYVLVKFRRCRRICFIFFQHQI